MDEEIRAADARLLTAEVVSAYVSNNSVRSESLPALIASVYRALTGLAEVALVPALEPLVKPVSVKKSIHNDYLISMEDGRQYQSLKRHLAGRGLTPADYRAKWDLPSDYPMTAPGYSKRRSALAKALGLGRNRVKVAAEFTPGSGASIPEGRPADVKPKRTRRKVTQTA